MRAFVLAISTLFLFSGCGIYSFSGASIPLEVKTMRINYFPNHALVVNPTLSDILSEGVTEKFLLQTNLNMINNPNDKVDWELSGSVTGYTDRPASTGADQALQNRLTIRVKVEFTDNVNDARSFEKTFTQNLNYPGDQALSDVEESLVDEMTKQMIEDIFNKIAANW